MAKPEATREQALAVIKAELQNPTWPTTGGAGNNQPPAEKAETWTYVNGTSSDDADSANHLNRKDQLIGTTRLSGMALWNEIDYDEFIALTEPQRSWLIGLVTAAGDRDAIDVTDGEIAEGLQKCFTGGSNTRANLQNIAIETTRLGFVFDVAGYADPNRLIKGSQIREAWEYTP